MAKRRTKKHGFLLQMKKHGEQFETPYWSVITPRMPTATQWARLGLLINTTGELHPNVSPPLDKAREYIDEYLRENDAYNQLTNYGLRDLVNEHLRLWNGRHVKDDCQTLVSLDIAYLGEFYGDHFLEKISQARLRSEEGRREFELTVPHPFSLSRLRRHRGIISLCLERDFGVKIPVSGSEKPGKSLYTLNR